LRQEFGGWLFFRNWNIPIRLWVAYLVLAPSIQFIQGRIGGELVAKASFVALPGHAIN
jgi:hypothetical protein